MYYYCNHTVMKGIGEPFRKHVRNGAMNPQFLVIKPENQRRVWGCRSVWKESIKINYTIRRNGTMVVFNIDTNQCACV